jgi:hypothetical protein
MKNFKFQKWKFSIFSFQIFVTNFKIFFFQIFSIYYGEFFGFKIQKQKINSNFKKDFSNFPYDINEFFLSSRLLNLVKDCKNYLFALTKIVLYCIPPLGDMINHKRALWRSGYLSHPEISNFRMWIEKTIKQQFSHNLKFFPIFIFFTRNIV